MEFVPVGPIQCAKKPKREKFWVLYAHIKERNENCRDARSVVKTRSWSHMSCASLLVDLWYVASVSRFEKECTSIASYYQNYGSESGHREAVEKKTVLAVVTSARHYTRSVGLSHQSTITKRAAHTSVVEPAISFGRAGETWSELYRLGDHSGHWRIPTNHTRWENVKHNIPWAPLEERFICCQLKSSGRKMILSEMWPIICMLDVESKSCKAEELGRNSCTRTRATKKTSLQLPQHCCLVDFKRSSWALWSFCQFFRTLLQSCVRVQGLIWLNMVK